VSNGQDLQIISLVPAVGGVGKWKSWCLVVSGGWVDRWRDTQFCGEEVKCAGGWERGAVAGSLCRTEIWSQPVIILGEKRAEGNFFGKRGEWGSCDERNHTDGR